MAARLRTRISRALNKALIERDRAEMRAVGELLSLMEPTARRRRKNTRRTAARRKRA